MNRIRFFSVFRRELSQNVRRPFFWIMILLVLFIGFGISKGNVRVVASGDAEIGGTKAWITSEFSNAFFDAVLIFILYIFFISVTAGLSVIRDDEQKITELLHSTPLKPSEYVWGKALAVVAVFLIVLSVQVSASMFFNHAVPHTENIEFFGPFQAAHYIRPAVIFGLPVIFFITGLTFLMGEWTRNSRLLFFLPVIILSVTLFFLWEWSPSWLDIRIDRMLMLSDPAGLRWLSQTWIKVDQGTQFYNHSRVPMDGIIIGNRILFTVLGFAAIGLSQFHFGRVLRRSKSWSLKRRNPPGYNGSETIRTTQPAAAYRPLGELGMTGRTPSFFETFPAIVRVELRELLFSAGLYLFVPIILLNAFSDAMTSVGPMDTPLLTTSGLFAVNSMEPLTLTVCLLLMFYMVESARREKATGLAPVYRASPVGNFAVLSGKAAANGLVGVLIVLVFLVVGITAILVQGRVPVEIKPFAVVWGLLLFPTFVAWSAFAMVVYSATRNRYSTYAVCLSVLIFTGYRQATGHMNWVGNWNLWKVLQWSDMGVLEMDRYALVLNRIMILGLAVLFTVLAVKLFERRTPDASGRLNRLQFPVLLRLAATLIPFMIIPLAAGIVLFHEVGTGFQGSVREKAEKDYWRHNLATWKDTPVPDIAHVDLDVELYPETRGFAVSGTYRLINPSDKPLRRFPVTGGPDWSNLAWTLAGKPYEPENRSNLYVFTPVQAMASGETILLGFTYEGIMPGGITRNGGGSREFILPSGVVLTSFNPEFVPDLGFHEEVGIDEDNRYDAKVYPDDYYEGITGPFIGPNRPFTTDIRVELPVEYTANSVGMLKNRRIENDRAVYHWITDCPVRFFNIVAGRWDVRKGDGTALYYHPGHGYNVEVIGQAMDAARKYYSDWFMPYPWGELKISEFPGLAYYAQGFPTNITFSEALGFLAKDDPRTQVAFFVAAHEIAHQWWANILMSGKGPGGNVFLEGMANFSSILLFDQVKGDYARMEFCRRLEHDYGENRQKDSERPLVKVDGSRPGDNTVTYNRSAWIYWMMLNLMGRENALTGIRDFILAYRDGPDHPALQDFVEFLKRYAPDSGEFDRFVAQFFFDTALPEYRIDAVESNRGDDKWWIRFRLTNAGTGEISVDIAATAGKRFSDDTGESVPGYRESRITARPGAGESLELLIACDFEPERLMVDPDVTVLQLKRHLAAASIK
ncbi:hypothetical protein JXA40_02550 [bacterium]|nr:hypothetical protein [candidate division CSSED10-310 bacterium]